MASTAISIDEYLKTVPDPDVEYIDGQLREKPMVFNEHGLMQSEICTWFNNHRKEWGVRAGIEGRTAVSSTRIRLPDVIVDYARKWPEVFTQPPMVVIEILSPRDSFMEIEDKCSEYSSMGIKNVWVINPQGRSGRVWRDNTWLKTTRFEIEGTAIVLDLEWLFTQMDSYEDRAELD